MTRTAQVATGFEKVADVFEAGRSALGAGGGAFAAYVDGEAVVDLWGGSARPGEPWQADTLAVLMSTTKGLVTMCAQVLFDRGQLDLDAPVAQYWPEFAKAGKEGVLVRHVLTHTAGVIGVGAHTERLGEDGTGWDDYDAIAAALCETVPSWEPGTRFGYHAMSYGWLVGEIVRRITGDTVGAFFRKEIAGPLGVDAFIGTPDAEHARVAHVIDRLTADFSAPVRALYPLVRRRLVSPKTLIGQAFLATGKGSILDAAEVLFASAPGLRAEIPSGNGTATAHALARVYAALACGGELDGVRLMSEDTVKRFAAVAMRWPDQVMRQTMPGVGRLLAPPTGRTIGYLLNPRMRGERPRFGPNPLAFGHDGAGGQIAFADLDRRVAVGFVRNELRSNAKFSTALIEAVYNCL
jgi:CubicO group peptidase (beta-lactamase class C family)